MCPGGRGSLGPRSGLEVTTFWQGIFQSYSIITAIVQYPTRVYPIMSPDIVLPRVNKGNYPEHVFNSSMVDGDDQDNVAIAHMITEQEL